jgi:hypothetical protein
MGVIAGANALNEAATPMGCYLSLHPTDWWNAVGAASRSDGQATAVLHSQAASCKRQMLPLSLITHFSHEAYR